MPLTDGEALFPGVIDSTDNYIKHPELVAQRLIRYAYVVGRENIVATTDCGLGTTVGGSDIAPPSPGPSSRRWPKARTSPPANCGDRPPAGALATASKRGCTGGLSSSARRRVVNPSRHGW